MPASWEEVTWGDLATLEYGKGLRDYQDVDGPYPVYGTNGQIGWYQEPLCDEPGVIIGRKGAYRGVHFSDSPFYVIDTAFYLKPEVEYIDIKWAYYQLLDFDVNNIDSGTAIPSTSREAFYAITVKLPPLPTQRKIAAILSAYDDLIENNSRRIAILEEMAQLVYREWFVHFRFPGHEDVAMVEFDVEDLDINGDFPHLTTVPSGWEIRRLGDLAKRMRRGADPQELPEETPYIGLGHMPKESIALSEWGSASETKSRKYRFKRGEILFGRIRPYFHKVGVAPVDGIGSTDIIVITPKSPESFALILGCVSSKRFVDYATQTSSGTKMPRAKWKILVDYPVLIPPKPILDQYSALIEDIVAQINNLIFRNRTLRQTRDLLLPRLVSGELDVADLPIAMEAVDSQ